MSKRVIHGFPFLKYSEDKTAIVGSIIVAEGDEYDIKIELRGFPKGIPAVYETDGRIPRKADRHAYEGGRLCLTTDTNMEIYLKLKVKTIEDFIGLLVVPYLLNNSYYEINREYRFGEYAHGPEFSTYDTYCDILGVRGLVLVIQVVEERRKIRPNDECYCGSHIVIRNCSDHYNRYKYLRVISGKQLENDLIQLQALRRSWNEFSKRGLNHLYLR